MRKRTSISKSDQTKGSNLQKADNLFKLFGIIHNHIYANEGLSSQEAFSEFLKILFIKIENDRNSNKKPKFYISESELDDISNGKDSPFRQRIIKLFEKAKNDYSNVFSKDEQISLKTSTIGFVVDKLQKLNLSKSDRDVKGTAFQKFVYTHQRGERGQFFTPAPIVKLCVNFLSPREKETVLDPACGTGGFLIETMRYLNNRKRDFKMKTYTEKKLRGIEINPLISKVAKMRMILEGDGHGGIINADSLSSWEDLNRELHSLMISNTCKNSFDIVLTNPPFGSQGKITTENILRDFSLAYKWRKDVRGRYEITSKLKSGQAPEILFIERCLDFLKDSGRLAIVLPNGYFENSSFDYIREYVNARAKILAIISLPPETFIPHGTGVRASVLFLRKLPKKVLEKKKSNNYKIFFGKITKIGYKGNKNGDIIYKKNEKGELVKDNNRDFIIDEDVSEITEAYKRFKRKETTITQRNTFAFGFNELHNRLDVEYYHPNYRRIKKSLLGNSAKKLGDIVEIVKEKSSKLRSPENKIKYIELSDVNPLYGELISYSEIQVHEAPSRASYEVREGDIITAVAGNSVGSENHATAFVTSEFDGAVCTNGFRVLRTKDINPYYLFTFLKSDLFLSQMFQLRTGAAIPSVSDEDFKNILISIPSKAKQKQIERTVKQSFALRKKSKDLLKRVKI